MKYQIINTITLSILLVLIAVLIFIGCSSKKETTIEKDYPIKPVEFTKVDINDNFWLPRIKVNNNVTINYDFDKCEETCRIDNFAIAGNAKEGVFKGLYYNDSDVFKVMEGAAYSLALDYDEKLDRYLDSLISLIAAAQEDDGYLYTIRTIKGDSIPKYLGKTRWQKLIHSHELYNIGHMYEAAVAHYKATGKSNFLDIAIKSADLVVKTFREDKLKDPPGHQEIELGLIKLYRVTNDTNYLNTAKFFLDVRGNKRLRKELYESGYGKYYVQDHKPVTEQFEAVGHAVRATYMYSAMADVAAITGNKEYKIALDSLWKNVVTKKLYITGGIGAKPVGEAFGKNYELPNLEGYNETCASIGNMLWNYRMFLLSGKSKYIDVFEQTLYNSFLSGVGITGNKFFYPNKLKSDGTHERSPWFACSCCPTNIARFIPSIPGYIYALKDDELFVNLFISNNAVLEIKDTKLEIKQKTEYPWNGNTTITVNAEKETNFSLKIRIPSWVESKFFEGNLYRIINPKENNVKVSLNGKIIDNYKLNNGYIIINNNWNDTETVELEFPMSVSQIKANDKVINNKGKIAFQRGPLVYCAEGSDNNKKIHNKYINLNDTISVTHSNKNLFKHNISPKYILETQAYNVNTGEDTPLKLIPYYYWAQRGANEMAVWLPVKKEIVDTNYYKIKGNIETNANYNADINLINDYKSPVNCVQKPEPVCFDSEDSSFYVQFNFDTLFQIYETDIYWSNNNNCQLPKAWKLLYKEKTEWKEVYNPGDYPIETDKYSVIEFAPVKTKAARLIIEQEPNKKVGVFEWIIK